MCWRRSAPFLALGIIVLLILAYVGQASVQPVAQAPSVLVNPKEPAVPALAPVLQVPNRPRDAVAVAVPEGPGRAPRAVAGPPAPPQPPAPPATPVAGMMLAARDAAAHPTEAGYFRYLWTGPTPRGIPRDTLARVMSFHVNSLSSEPELTPVLVVDDGSVFRIDLRAYGETFAKVWDKLAALDPYFHVQVIPSIKQVTKQRRTTEENGVHWTWDGERWVRTFDREGRRQIAAEYTSTESSEAKTALAPWLSETPEAKAALAELVKLTQTPVPIVYAPWFIWQTAISEDRNGAGYYEFLGIKTDADYERLIGFNNQVLKNFRQEGADAIFLSPVTARKKPRAFVAKAKANGHEWYTIDVNLPTDKSNPIRVFDPDRNLVGAAKEKLGTLPNGLLATAVVKADDGTLQTSAPPNIAHDYNGDNNDGNVYAGIITCLRCHNNNGFNDLKPYVRGTLQRDPFRFNETVLKGIAEKEQVRLRQIYYSDIEGWLDDDRRVVGRAMTRVSGGWTPAKLTGEYVRAWEQVRSPVDADRAAAELGVTRAAMQTGFERFLKATGAIDPVLATYFPGEKDRMEAARGALEAMTVGDPVQVEMWFEAYPLAQFAIRGVVVPPQIEEIER